MSAPLIAPAGLEGPVRTAKPRTEELSVSACDQHDYVIDQKGDVLSRMTCLRCSDVRIEQEIDRHLALVWSDEDYRIADRFYRELVS